MYVYNNLTNLVAPPVPFDSRGQLSNQQIEFQPQTPSFLIFDADLLQITFPDDVQEEANSFFQAIYTQKPYMLSVQGLVEKPKAFKNSMDPRDHKLLACVVKSLFEEYKFFNEYPDRELRITAELYGGIIREGVINETTNCHFANVVRKIIESLSQHPTTKLFTFGLIVLEHCRAKLCTYPKVCSMISGLDNFMRFPPAIREYVQAGMTGDLKRIQEPGPRLSAPPAWTVPQATDNRIGSQNRGLSQVTAETLIRAARNFLQS